MNDNKTTPQQAHSLELSATELRYLRESLGYDKSTVFRVLNGERNNPLVLEYALRIVALRTEMQTRKMAKVANDKANLKAARTVAGTPAAATA